MLDQLIHQLATLDERGAEFDDVIITVHQLMRGVRAAELAGQPRDAIRGRLQHAWALHGQSPFIRRLQTWPRGYAGDFETIEYLCEGVNRAEPGTLSHALERYALNCGAAQQHRNKVAVQGRLILDAFRRGRGETRVLSLACGGSRDIAPFVTELAGYGGTLVVNDVDPGALALTQARLKALGEHLVVVPGNAMRRYDDVAAAGPYDLAVAGGLFDYLPTPVATRLVSAVYRSLRPGGRFFWTNMAVGNPYRPWIEHLADWVLIERSEADVYALTSAAGIDAAQVSTAREETGLTVLVTIEKPGA